MWVWGFGNHKWYKSLVKSRVADEWLDKRLLFHAWFPKPHTHISALTALALLKTTNKRYEITNEMRYLFERNEIFKHFGQCTHMWLHWLLQISNFTRQKNLWNWCWSKVNVLTCEYIDFCLAHVTTLTVIYKMYKNCAITFNLHDKLFHRVATIVVFNNAQCLRTDLNKRFLPKPNTTIAWKLIPHRSNISKIWNPPRWELFYLVKWAWM